MKTVLVLASLVALALAGDHVFPQPYEYTVKTVDQDFVTKQNQLLKLFTYIDQVDTEAKYYPIGKEFDIEQHVNDYTNTQAVEHFLKLWKVGFLPKNTPFSIFNKRSQEEAIALFRVMYYAKDFDVFYKTAAFARVYMNAGQFFYSYYMALLHRPDCKNYVIPAPYEVYPELFTNDDVWYRVHRIKMQNGSHDFGQEYGVYNEEGRYVVYANYSDRYTYANGEDKISYFTEDVGLNSFYYFFHVFYPFWMQSDEVKTVPKEYRGEIYFNFYQQLLARYYLERLSSGLGEIPEFSWDHQVKAGYNPSMKYYYNFVQRPNYYQIPYEKHDKEVLILKTFEQTFLYFMQEVHFKAFNQDIDLRNSKSVNFVGNFWQGNSDAFTKVGPWSPPYSYEVVARHVLSGVDENEGKYDFVPSALGFYQTSLRDPAFYQLYSRIMKYFIDYKKFLTPYTQDNLHYVGVKINDVQVDKLVTYFEFYDFEVTNGVFFTKEEMTSPRWPYYVVRQPRLNHKKFTVTVDVKSDVEEEAVFKIFLGPKYDGKGYLIDFENNWQNFVELDWFVRKLTKGQNKIVRQSTDFYYTREDSLPIREIFDKYLSQSKVPHDMSVKPGAFPQRLVLPKGTENGFPYQIYVVAYPYQQTKKTVETFKVFANDNKPLGYPLDRPVDSVYFKQPNMFFKDVKVYHEGEIYPYEYTVPYYTYHHNEVKQH